MNISYFCKLKFRLNMDELGTIRQPVADDLLRYKQLFDAALAHDDDFLGQALKHVRARQGKMMRPLLVLLVARELGEVGQVSLLSAVTLELLHTASLVHDDVVDNSGERRGQASANAVYGNKVAVLLGDYLLSKSLSVAAQTGRVECVSLIARLGERLSEGEIFQLANIRNAESTEEAYFHIIRNKTAELFATCAHLGALSAGGSDDFVEHARKFGEIVGICFQIRDDIFDYYDDAAIGKPTGNDMAEGKLTLPAIYALRHSGNPEIKALAAAIKGLTASREDIHRMVELTKSAGGIDYAWSVMQRLRQEALAELSAFRNGEVKRALEGYLDFVIGRKL